MYGDQEKKPLKAEGRRAGGQEGKAQGRKQKAKVSKKLEG